MSDRATDGLIETAMKIRIYRHHTHPDQRPLRRAALYDLHFVNGSEENYFQAN